MNNGLTRKHPRRRAAAYLGAGVAVALVLIFGSLAGSTASANSGPVAPQPAAELPAPCPPGYSMIAEKCVVRSR